MAFSEEVGDNAAMPTDFVCPAAARIGQVPSHRPSTVADPDCADNQVFGTQWCAIQASSVGCWEGAGLQDGTSDPQPRRSRGQTGALSLLPRLTAFSYCACLRESHFWLLLHPVRSFVAVLICLLMCHSPCPACPIPCHSPCRCAPCSFLS